MGAPRYRPLAGVLGARQGTALRLGFADVERIIQWRLPRSARRHRAWWANTRMHVQAVAWLEAGWVVEAVDLAAETVRFVRLPS